MTKQRLKASEGKAGFITVFVHKGKIVMDKYGFCKVKDHPMWMDTIRYEYIEKYYDVPKGMEP
jgi:hypothetical protein